MRALLALYVLSLVGFSRCNPGEEGNASEGTMPTHVVGPNISEFVKPESPPAYFGIDFDETFHAKEEEAMKRNVEAFAEVKKKGHTPFFCTGKPLSSILELLGEDFVKTTGYNGFPGVYNGGAIVYDEHGKTIYSQTFEKNFLSAFMDSIEKGELPKICTFHSEDAVYSLISPDERWKQYLSSQGFQVPEVKTPEELVDLKIVNIYIFCQNLKIGDLVQGTDYNAVMTESGVYDVNPPGVSKATGMVKLMEHFNVKPADCAFVGDGLNDIDLMKMSDISFAVANAKDSVKKHAKWVLDKTCDEGGVAEAFKLTYELQIP